MLKNDFFIKSLFEQNYNNRQNTIKLFSMFFEGADEWKKDPYPYRLVISGKKYLYVDPKDKTRLLEIEDSNTLSPLFTMKDEITLTNKDFPSVNTKVKTTIGNTLVNYLILYTVVGDKHPFVSGEINIGKIEEWFAKRMIDGPFNGEEIDPDKVYVADFLTFSDNVRFLDGFTQIAIPSFTQKLLTPAPGMFEFRDKLLADNKGKLDDPAILADIQKQMIEYDKKYMSDDDGINILIGEKGFAIHRSKLYGMGGVETGLTDAIMPEVVTKSLYEGWQIEDFPTIVNTLRAGSHKRSAQTVKGGETYKALMRAGQNLKVVSGDCGSKRGIKLLISKDNITKIDGCYIIDGPALIHISSSSVAQRYLGKVVEVRSPMYCKLPHSDYCATCVGDNLAAHPLGLAVVLGDFGSVLLSIFMKAAHGKALATERMDPFVHIS